MSYAEVNGLSLHYQPHGSGDGAPLVLLHGGFGAAEMLGPVLPALAETRRVIAVDLQGHGRTADIDRPLRPEALADDIAGLIESLGLARADLMGYSLGGLTALRTAIQHSNLINHLVVVSVPGRRSGNHPEVVAQMDELHPDLAEMMKQTPIYEHYSRVSPRAEDWPVLVAKMGELLKRDYDWTDEIAKITAPTILVFADADATQPGHIVELFALLGGGLRDAGVDGSGRPAARLAILPGATHYDLLFSPLLAPAVTPFLDTPLPDTRAVPHTAPASHE
jgi:pimeloyl-ACP methyl ester carboxylesterase